MGVVMGVSDKMCRALGRVGLQPRGLGCSGNRNCDKVLKAAVGIISSIDSAKRNDYVQVRNHDEGYGCSGLTICKHLCIVGRAG